VRNRGCNQHGREKKGVGGIRGKFGSLIEWVMGERGEGEEVWGWESSKRRGGVLVGGREEKGRGGKAGKGEWNV